LLWELKPTNKYQTDIFDNFNIPEHSDRHNTAFQTNYSV
jgi:hypothetical protein